MLGIVRVDITTVFRAPAGTYRPLAEIAIEIESSEMEDLCQKLTAPIAGPPHVVQKKLDLSKKEHLSKLRTAAERFGASAAIRSRFEEIG